METPLTARDIITQLEDFDPDTAVKVERYPANREGPGPYLMDVVAVTHWASDPMLIIGYWNA